MPRYRWGGVGCIRRFVEFTHMFDRCYATDGAGWGRVLSHLLNLHAWLLHDRWGGVGGFCSRIGLMVVFCLWLF